MRLLTTIAALAVIAAASSDVLHPLSEERIAEVNAKAKTWKAGKNFEIEDWEKVKMLSSGVLSGSKYSQTHKNNEKSLDIEADLPESFDSRDSWPKCDSLNQIWDQSSCGSCWAVAAASAMSDRICIHSDQTQQVYVSADDLLSCCYGFFACGYGCDGGYIAEPWEYWRSTGIVTGGLYNSSQGCKDYSLEPCEHHVDSGSRPQCSSLDYDTPACVESCYDKSLDYKTSLTYGGQVSTFSDAKAIQNEIYKNGPVEAAFTVYDDFPLYKSGVYQATSDNSIGGHAIRIIGWGVEENTPYWLIANSWNSDWGDKGYFKFLRGVDHCGIESDVAASLPEL